MGKRSSSPCCSGRDGAHFGWCATVGGCGCKPGSPEHQTFLIRTATAVARQATRKIADPVRKAQAKVLTALVGTGGSRPEPARPVVVEEPATPPVTGRTVVGAGAIDPEWERLTDDQLNLSAYRLQQLCEKGLPTHVPFEVWPEVEALDGYDDARVRGTLTHPSWVEVRPETKAKKYPVLGFHRGDVHVVMGFRTPSKPLVIACYWASALQHDTHRVAKTGGGGAKRSTGLPRNGDQVGKALTSMGCTLSEKVHTTGGQTTWACTVTYAGQDLGCITQGPGVRREQAETDYQRTIRKVQAIDRRKAAASA